MNDVRVVLRLRTLVPQGISPIQSDVIDRLQTLGDEGSISELDVDVWGSSMGINVPADRDPIRTRETVAEFEQWADRQDCTLRPAFDRRSTESTDSNEDTLILPLLCLAVYDEETVQAVYPHTDSEEVHTIHDGLDALESMVAGNEHLEPEDQPSEELSVPAE
jgi:hypothetical protein